MKPNLNLASRTYLNRRLLYASYGLAILVLALLLTGWGVVLWQKQQAVTALKQEITGFKREMGLAESDAEDGVPAEKLQALKTRVAFANSVLRKDTFRWTELLDRLETVVPDGVGLRDIQPDYRDGSLRIGGLARNLVKLQLFLDNLLASPDFSSVYLMNQTRLDPRAGQGSQALSFSLVLKGAF